MRSHMLCTLLPSLTAAFSDLPATASLSKRAAQGVYCYSFSRGDFSGFSAACPSINWPIENDKGLDVLEVFYFAMVATSLPDDTVYQALENIICTVPEATPNITTTIDAKAGLGPLSGGGSVTFSFHAPNIASNAICMRITGEYNQTAAPNITLAQARDRLRTLLTAPNVDCKTCGQIRIQQDNSPVNSSDPGAILKADVTTDTNCLGNCVGPNSFSKAKTTPSPSPSKSAGKRNVAAGIWSTQAVFGIVAAAWLLGLVVFGILTVE